MKRLQLTLAASLLAIGMPQTGIAYDDDKQGDDRQPEQSKAVYELNPEGAGYGSLAVTKGSTGTITPAITWHGGPVMATPVIYLIWYGNWNQANNSDTPAGQQIVRDWAQAIGGSSHFGINTSYSTASTAVTGNVVFGGETTDTGSQGTALTDAKIQTIVTAAIGGGKLPFNANGVYFVLTSSNVNETSGFCTQYCGWHTAGNTSVGHLRYSFVGNANRCLSGCAAQTVGPNGNAGVDGMISVMTHELEETTSDPDINAWYDRRGAENGDKCAWTFGQTLSTAPNGALYNLTLGARNYLIQRNLKHAASGDKCFVDATRQ